MAVRQVLTFPDPRLKLKSSPVEAITDDIKRVLADLKDTLDDSKGCVGVAAPQIGEPVRIIIIDASRGRKPCANHGLLYLVNPVVTFAQGDVLGREGCLSIPDFTANVRRPQRVTVSALDENMTETTLETCDFEARLLLHEMDHLDGILFLDRVSSLKTDVFRRKTGAQIVAHLKATGARLVSPENTEKSAD